MGQRSGYVWIRGFSKVFIFCKRNSNARFCVKIASALNRIIHDTQFKRRVNLEEQKAQKKRTVSFVDVRSLTWSTNTSVQEPTILLRIMPTCSQLFFKMMTFRNSIVNDENPIWWHLGRIVQIKNTRVWETQDRIGIVRPGDSSEEVRTWFS